MFIYEEYMRANELCKKRVSLCYGAGSRSMLPYLPHIEGIIDGPYPFMDKVQICESTKRYSKSIVELINQTYGGEEAVGNPSALSKWRGWGKEDLGESKFNEENLPKLNPTTAAFLDYLYKYKESLIPRNDWGSIDACFLRNLDSSINMIETYKMTDPRDPRSYRLVEIHMRMGLPTYNSFEITEAYMDFIKHRDVLSNAAKEILSGKVSNPYHCKEVVSTDLSELSNQCLVYIKKAFDNKEILKPMVKNYYNAFSGMSDFVYIDNLAKLFEKSGNLEELKRMTM